MNTKRKTNIAFEYSSLSS